MVNYAQKKLDTKNSDVSPVPLRPMTTPAAGHPLPKGEGIPIEKGGPSPHGAPSPCGDEKQDRAKRAF